jgi:SAM-dependent methyltransferase
MITLARRQMDFGGATVVMSRGTGSVFYYHGDSCQSEADRNGISLAPYIHAIYDLLLQCRARHVLMIGCGGGTLGTMLARSCREVVIVDDDPYAITVAKRYFSLPFEVTCHVVDGLTFLKRNEIRFDAIVVDAFTCDRMPDHLCSVDFFKIACRNLRAGGSVFVNALVAHDLDLCADHAARRIGVTGLQTLILDTLGRVNRNAIVVGGEVDQLKLPSSHFIPEVEAEELAHELKLMRFRKARGLR